LRIIPSTSTAVGINIIPWPRRFALPPGTGTSFGGVGLCNFARHEVLVFDRTLTADIPTLSPGPVLWPQDRRALPSNSRGCGKTAARFRITENSALKCLEAPAGLCFARRRLASAEVTTTVEVSRCHLFGPVGSIDPWLMNFAPSGALHRNSSFVIPVPHAVAAAAANTQPAKVAHTVNVRMKVAHPLHRVAPKIEDRPGREQNREAARCRAKISYPGTTDGCVLRLGESTAV
jgi:hypothetical protein